VKYNGEELKFPYTLLVFPAMFIMLTIVAVSLFLVAVTITAPLWIPFLIIVLLIA